MATTTVTNVINVVQGKKKEFTLDIDKGDDPFDLSAGGTVVKVCMPGADGTPVELQSGTELTITDPALGKISGTIPSAKSELLEIGEGLSVQVEVDSGGSGEFEAVILKDCLNVEAKIC